MERSRSETTIRSTLSPISGRETGGTNARSVYVRSGEEAVISGLGLGLYQAFFHTVSGRDALRRQSNEYYRLDDAMRFYEVRMAGETQSVRYIVTVP
jgi:hypothetical protein